jgi:hypothetical protein
MSEHAAKLREFLAEVMEETANWRRSKAEEYPDDPRNLAAAGTLEEWAKDVRSLPDDDPALEPFLALQDERREPLPEVLFSSVAEYVDREPTSKVGFQFGARALPELLEKWAAEARARLEEADREEAESEEAESEEDQGGPRLRLV